MGGYSANWNVVYNKMNCVWIKYGDEVNWSNEGDLAGAETRWGTGTSYSLNERFERCIK